jgi:hypothetical protein
MKFKSDKQRRAVMARLRGFAFRKSKYAVRRKDSKEKMHKAIKERKKLEKKIEKIQNTRRYKQKEKELRALYRELEELNEPVYLEQDGSAKSQYAFTNAQMERKEKSKKLIEKIQKKEDELIALKEKA